MAQVCDEALGKRSPEFHVTSHGVSKQEAQAKSGLRHGDG